MGGNWCRFRRPRRAHLRALRATLVDQKVRCLFSEPQFEPRLLVMLSEGLTLQSSAYGGFFYLIVGTHALHAVCALGALVWAFSRLDKDQLTASELGTVSAFWYFVVLVWPILYWQVYL